MAPCHRSRALRAALALAFLAMPPSASADGPRLRLDPLRAGELGFRVVPGSGERLERATGLDAAGRSLTVKVAPTRPAVLYFFPARLASSRAVLDSLENLRADYAGKLGFVALSPDLHEEVGACASGLGLSLPVLGECGIGRDYGLERLPGFLVIAPGGWVLAKREGAFDWSSGSGRAFLDEIVAMFPDAPPEILGMPILPVAPTAQAAADPARDLRLPEWLSPLEASVVQELNLARTDPGSYAAILADYRTRIEGNRLRTASAGFIRLQEGERAVDEAIAFLRAQRPLSALGASRGLSLAAREHAEDQGRSGATGHVGSDGSSPFQRMERHGDWGGTAGENCSYGPDTAREIVIALIVDDGVPSRGHRSNIFSRDYAEVGVGVASHPVYGAVCVQDFAWSFREK